MRSNIISKIIIVFMMMFILLLTPVIIQTYTSFKQEQSYRGIINNITYANQLNTDVNSKIEPIVWNIVAGKVTFENSGLMPLIADIRMRMNDIKRNTYSIENSGVMEISLRALNTLENYLIKLKTQIDENAPVEENEKLFEEIRVCVAGINELLQEFSSKQVVEVSILNEKISRQSNYNFIINTLWMLIVIFVGIFSFRYIVKLLIEESIEKQRQTQMLEHKVLQAQITPHFLYNTLDTIIWAAEAKDTSSVIKLVSSLSSFFRISLSQGIDVIPISNEIEHVRSYLTIQQMRYSDVLSYEINVDEGLRDQKILKLLLQPLVENSLYHGIKNTRGRGKIIVSVKKEGDKIRFTVADNGIGMTEETLRGLKNEINHGSGEKGYGLFNVNRRLKLYYGLPEDIEIKSEYRKGTEVSFVLNIE